MCRFLVYKGSDEILLSKLILDPSHSILTQSFDSRLRLDTRRPHNGDGFGIGYYTDPKLGPEPCIFTSTTPAWNCTNLRRIAAKTASPLIFAHVRATTEGSLSEDNCHPFNHGSLMWMHNGGLGAWSHIKRRLVGGLADKWYLGIHGSTDSECAFALFLDTLERMGHDPSSPPETGFGPMVLRKAILQTIEQINSYIRAIPESVIKEENVDTRSLLNFAVTDGHSVVCTRYVTSKTDEAASLYYSSGTSWENKRDGDYHMNRKDKGADIVLVASEPLTFERDNWVTVPTNSTLTIHKQTVMVHPIIDEYYNHAPYHQRSSAFVVEKGLVSNEKNNTSPGSSTPTSESGGPAPSIDPRSSFPPPPSPTNTFGTNRSIFSHQPSPLSTENHPVVASPVSPLSPTSVEPKSFEQFFKPTPSKERHNENEHENTATTHLSPPPTSHSAPAPTTSSSDLRHLTPIPNNAQTTLSKTREVGNTKKRRVAPVTTTPAPAFEWEPPAIPEDVRNMGSVGSVDDMELAPPRHSRTTSYGTSAKLAKMFPELGLGVGVRY